MVEEKYYKRLMGARIKLLILKRIRAGDNDILVKAYGQGGVVDILVREGLLSNNRFFSIFEPFNILEADVVQKGGILIPNDVSHVERLSYLVADYERFIWMSWVSGFILKHSFYYDDRLFSMFVRYMFGIRRPLPVHKLRLRMDYLALSGWEPKFLKELKGKGNVRVKLSDGSVSGSGELTIDVNALRLLSRIYLSKDVGRFKIRGQLLSFLEDFLDRFIEYHTR